MDLFTHAVFGALIYGTLGGDLTSEYYFFALLFAILPDFDLFLTPLKKIFNSDYFEHRGGSHSYIIGVGVSLVGSIIFSILFSKSFLLAWLIGSLFYGLHLCMDLLTTTLIPIFYPISKKEYSFYVEKAGSMFTMICSIVIAAFGMVLYQQPTLLAFRIYNGVSLLLFIGYYGYRIKLRKKTISNLIQTQKYFPGVFPHQYYIYDFNLTQESIKINLAKGSRTYPPIVYLEKEWSLTRNEMEVYEMAVQMCNEDYYRNKWTKIPFVERNGSTISIKFFFLETMMNGKSMSLNYDFDKFTKKLNAKTQKYGRVYPKLSN